MADKTVSVRLQAITSQYQAQMAQAAASTRAFGLTAGKSLTNASASVSTMSKAGLGLRAGLANPLGMIATPAGGAAIALALSAKAAIDFESAWTGVEKTVEGTPEQLAALQQGIRDMALELPAAHAEIAGVAEAAGQLGIETDNIEDFTRTMIDLGETTNLTADQAATSLAQLANITQMPQDQFDRLGSTIVQLGNDGASTEAQIAEMGLRIAGAGHQVGMSEADILGFAEALSSLGIHAEMGGSAISRVMMKLHKVVEMGGDSLEKFAAVAGMSGQQFAQTFRKDAPAAIVAFTTGLGNLEGTGTSAIQILEELGITEQRTSDMLLRLAGSGDLVAKSIANGNRAWDENSALSTEAEKRYATTAAQLEVFKNHVVDLAISLGQVLLPVINSLLGPLSDLVSGIGDVIQWGGNLINQLPGMETLNDALGFEDLEPDTSALEDLQVEIGALLNQFDGFDEPRRQIDALGKSLRATFRDVASAEFAHSNRELRLLAEAFDDTEKEAQELTDAIETLIGVHLGLDEAAVDFRSALADLQESIKANGATLDINTEKGRENRGAFTAAAQSALDLANAQIEAGASTEKTTQRLRDNIKELRSEAIAAGMSEDAVDAYIKKLHLTPKDIQTLIKLFDEEANRKADAFRDKMNALNGKTVSTFINVITRSLGEVPGQVTGALTGSTTRHAGGEAGTSGAKRYYLGAPRLRSDEFPEILQRGEVILSAAQAARSTTTPSLVGVRIEGKLQTPTGPARISAVVVDDDPVGAGRRG